MGLTFDEEFNPLFGGRKSFDRVVGNRESGHLPGIPERAKDQPFQKAELLARVESGPEIRYDDLKEVVTANVSYDQIPFQIETHHQRIDAGSQLVSLTIAFRNADISFKETPQGRRSHLQLYGLIRTITKRIVQEFDDDIEALYSERDFPSALSLTGAFQKKVTLPPGNYKLDIVLKDTVSGRIGASAASVPAPRQEDENLSTSSIFLTRGIEASSREELGQPFVVGNYKVKPQVDRSFPLDGALGFYLELYNYRIDQATQLPALKFEYALTAHGGEERFRNLRRGLSMTSGRVYVGRMVQLNGLAAGRYELVCRISDTLSGDAVTVREPFWIRQDRGVP